MTQELTNLQADRQNQEVQTQAAAAAPTPLQNNGSVVPPGYQNMDLRGKAQQNPFQPPSTSEIHHQMWVGSFMLSLMAGLASGNPAAAIVGGMWGAIGIHDYGNTLQQRAKWTDQLQKDGHSIPAILKWYEDGDASELDKEDKNRIERDQMSMQDRHFAAQQDQQQRFHTDQMHEQDLNRAAADSRFYAGQRMADARAERALQAQVANQDRADARLEKQEQRTLDSEMRKTIDGPKQKQYYIQMAEKAMGDLERYRAADNRAGMAEAYHNVRNNLARASLGGGATLNEHDIEGATGLPSYYDQKANDLGILVNGKPSDNWMNATRAQIKDDIKNEQATITQQGQQEYDSIVAAGATPEEASARVNHSMIGTGIQPRDWSKPEAPQEKAPAEGSEHVSAGGVKFKVTKTQ